MSGNLTIPECLWVLLIDRMFMYFNGGSKTYGQAVAIKN